MASVQAKPWDFSQVLELINTLSPVNEKDKVSSRPIPTRPSMASRATMNGASSLPLSSPMDKFNRTDEGVSLGDFGKIWEYLGTPTRTSSPAAPKSAADVSPTLQQRMPEKADYTSDGAVYGTPSKRTIKWRDEANAGDLTDYAPVEDHDSDEKKLTKKQRQKKNKKEREKQTAEAIKSTSDVESEVEGHMRNTPARKASTHHILDTPTKTLNSSAKSTSPVKTARPSSPVKTTRPSSPVKNKKTPTKPLHTSRSLSENIPFSAPAKPVQPAVMTPQPKKKKPMFEPVVAAPQTPDFFKSSKETTQKWPVSKPYSKASTSPSPSPSSALLPSSVQPTRQASVPTKIIDQVPAINDTPTKSNRNAIQPKTVRSGEDRNWALLLKIIGNFYEDRASLVSPANMSNHSNDPRGIHVFVDASNIFIGFHDQLKRARGIPQHQYVPRVVLSFDALALLMERRRPVAKRCLVGSKPHMTAFDVAENVGYECNILDKVKKARELTERQKYFKEQELLRRRNSNTRKNGGNHSTGDSAGSGSETGTIPSHAPEAFVEQGVDEILHLKMMESIVDTEEPATIVLATGDAAQAEYSQGFLKMAERALKKGWKVELVSWSQNISQLYKKTTWSKQWGDRFRIIYLDDYAEELLDM